MQQNAMIRTIPAVAELHKVPGFDPLKYLKQTANANGEPVLRLELRYQKLWFRLAYPNGRLLLNPMRVTDQMALIEARVFFDRADSTPASSYTATKTVKESSGYIRDAQNEALSVALENAGFGIQLCDVAQISGGQHGSDIPVSRTQSPAVHNAPPTQMNNGPEQTGQAEQPISVEARQSKAAAVTEQPKQAAIVPGTQAPSEPSNAQMASAETNPVPSPIPEQTQANTCEPETSAAGNDPNAQSEPQKIANAGVVDFLSQAAKLVTQTGEASEPESPADGTAPAAPSYSADMPVEEICEKMTLEEARAVVVPTGTCKGWSIAQVAKDRLSSLKFYVYSQGTVDNVVKAAATLLWNEINQQKAG